MSIKVMSAVFDADLPPREKLVLLVFADYARDEGWVWPSLARVSRKSNYSPRTVWTSVRVLVKMGVLVEETDPPREVATAYAEIRKDRRPRLYRIRLPGLDDTQSVHTVDGLSVVSR